MPNEQQVLEAAYAHFGNWATQRQDFQALLDPNIHWTETDVGLKPGDYHGIPDVMGHLDYIQQNLASASLVSVSPKQNGWEARDNMQVTGDHLHCCISDVRFNGSLISRVIHCKGHHNSDGPCT